MWAGQPSLALIMVPYLLPFGIAGTSLAIYWHSAGVCDLLRTWDGVCNADRGVSMEVVRVDRVERSRAVLPRHSVLRYDAEAIGVYFWGRGLEGEVETDGHAV